MTEAGATGFVRVGAAVPPVRVVDFEFNREQTLALWRQAHDDGVAVLFFPELGLSAYTAGDLHMDRHVHAQCLASIQWLLERGRSLKPLVFVGMPLFVHPGVYNVAVAPSVSEASYSELPKTCVPDASVRDTVDEPQQDAPSDAARAAAA